MANNKYDLNEEIDTEIDPADEAQLDVDQEEVNLAEEVAPPQMQAATQPAPKPVNAAEQVVDGLVKQGKVSPEMGMKIKDQMASKMADHVITEQEKQDELQLQAAAPQVSQPAAPQIPKTVAKPSVSTADKFVKPAGMNAAEESQAPQTGMEAERGKLEGAVQKQIAGIAAQGKIGAEQAKSEEAVYGEKLKALEDHQKRVDNLRIQSENVFNSKIEQAQKIQDSLLKDKVDPDRYWKNLPTGNKIGVAIGLILSGFGGPTAASNTVEIIQDSIKRDIDVQKENIANKQAGLKGQMNLLELYRQKFQDGRQAESQYAITAMEMSKIKLEKVAAKYKSSAVQAQALQAIGQLEEKQAEEMMKMRAIELKNQAKIARPTQFGTPGEVDVNKLSKEEREAYVGGMGIASSKEAAKRLREMGGELLPAQVGVEKLLELAKKGNRLSLKDRAQISTRLTAIAGKLRIPFTGPGVLQEGEFKRLMAALGDPNKLIALKGVELKHLETVLDILKENIEEEKSLAGIKTSKSVKSFKPAEK